MSRQGLCWAMLFGEDAPVTCLAVELPVSSETSGWSDNSAVMVAAAAAGWPGMVLGPVRMSGRLIHPVVEILPAGLDRLSAGPGPELDRSTLALWESWPTDMGASPPERPLRIVGFIAEGTWRRAVTTAAWLAGYGASLIVRRSAPTPVRLSEADYRGITVVVVDEYLSAKVMVWGRSGPVLSAERTVAVRHREEYLFAAAISQGYLSLRPSVRTG